MKKSFMLFLCLALSFVLCISLVGCSDSSDTSESIEQEEVITEEPEVEETEEVIEDEDVEEIDYSSSAYYEQLFKSIVDDWKYDTMSVDVIDDVVAVYYNIKDNASYGSETEIVRACLNYYVPFCQEVYSNDSPIDDIAFYVTFEDANAVTLRMKKDDFNNLNLDDFDLGWTIMDYMYISPNWNVNPDMVYLN